MSKDNRIELLNVFKENLINKISSSVAELVTDELIKALFDFNVTKEYKEFIIYNDVDYCRNMFVLIKKRHIFLIDSILFRKK